MSKIKIHRQRFIQLLSQTTNKNFFVEVDEEFWHPNFTNKLMQKHFVDSNNNFNIPLLTEP